METPNSKEEKDPVKNGEQNEQKTLAEMKNIRNAHRETDRSRLDRFEGQAAPLSGRPANVDFEIHHPDGTTSVHADNQQGLVDMLVSLYGDQPLYGFEAQEQETSDPLPEKEDLGPDLNR
jgi:hypothetical protein